MERKRQAEHEPRLEPGTDEGRLMLVGFLIVQILIGYEWFMSGLVKVWRGGFPAGLPEELQTKSVGVGGWYRRFLDNTAIPNARFLGYVVMLGELIAGVVLIGVALIWLFDWDRLPRVAKLLLLAATALAAFGVIVLNINLHLANASAHPWLIPGSGFDEGVDLDSLMPAIELVIFVTSIRLWLRIMRAAAPVSINQRQASKAQS